jgi:hypothetical protein|uniref:Uncharacterized protein n=1 Tax=viral metagenome TaxID=1070528 RepID=A0A6C0CCQ9_9ZZZZ
MGADASKDYKGPDNPETDNNIYVVDKFSNYAKDQQYSYNIWVLLVICINAFILLLYIIELLSNLLYSIRRWRNGQIKIYKN